VRDLNLGPNTRKLIQNFHALDAKRLAEGGARHIENTESIAKITGDMVRMLERWLTIAWCWPDACPSQICGGPHVTVRYDFDKTVDVIEPANSIGNTFPEAPYHVITNT
jgi:hypothetical protein